MQIANLILRRWNRGAVLALLAFITTLAHGDDIPAIINYQGRLTDNLGNPVGSGYYEVEFRIWDHATLSGPGNLVWGRSFPLHIVTNGVFNVLLSDGGASVGSTNNLVDAFNGTDRYLGLTIAQSNGVSVSNSEISPRQQLASAPFAMRAQWATKTLSGSVVTDSLQKGAVTTDKIAATNVTSGNLADGAVTAPKIADGAVTAPKIAANAVTTAKIEPGAVTVAKLTFDDDVRLNNRTLYLRGNGDTTNGLQYSGAFGGVAVGGPALFGGTGGVLGTTSGGTKRQLAWSSSAGVSMFGSIVDLSANVQSVGTVSFTANTDGLMMFYGRRGQADFQVYPGGGTIPLFLENTTFNIKGATFYYDANNSDGRTVMWPIKKGDKFQWNIRVMDTGTAYDPANNYLFFLPLGISQGNNSITKN